MSQSQSSIKIGIATEEQVNQEFIDAWHRAEKGEITQVEDNLYFLDPADFFKTLSNRRIELLQELFSHKGDSIRALSKTLGRDYKNVYQDVQLLKEVGLIQLTPSQKLFVPWSKIQAEINLAV